MPSQKWKTSINMPTSIINGSESMYGQPGIRKKDLTPTGSRYRKTAYRYSKSVGAEIAQPQPAAIVTAVVGTKVP
jgi:hypothetical protein